MPLICKCNPHCFALVENLTVGNLENPFNDSSVFEGFVLFFFVVFFTTPGK